MKNDHHTPLDFPHDKESNDLDLDLNLEPNIEDIELDFELYKDGHKRYKYHLIGEKPIRVGYIGTFVPVIAEVLNNKTKSFEINNKYIDYIAKSTEVIDIDEQTFIDICLKNGVTPPDKN